ncbi:hypothetical protein H4R18_005759 [Coemansia javaensis]|uniref:LYR motif-containing protein Cup1-like N-terminal domain-containing protein n=1 Tax=Coemansia javaensis TaxID=2761396 RepID=A0A9W8LF29_9FUNG|nr:hypothetical protein H4R18_005759 [Coemansia javaensis]
MEFLLRTKTGARRLPTREQVAGVYRGILRQARAFFDENTREFIQTYARAQFHKNRNDRKAARAQKKLKWARATMHLLERANRHRFKDVMSVLEYGYGRKGPRRADMIEATVGVARGEGIFGNLREVARYRPAFYALAAHQLGEKKLQVDVQGLRSRHPLNIAKAQDTHWAQLRYRIVPPVDAATMALLEERARTGTVVGAAPPGCSAADAALLRRWEDRWVRVPPRRQVMRYYRELLQSVSQIAVSTQEGPGAAPKRVYSFTRSPLAGKQGPQAATVIDLAGLEDPRPPEQAQQQ